jgi:hypothetical protein
MDGSVILIILIVVFAILFLSIVIGLVRFGHFDRVMANGTDDAGALI